MFADGVWTQKLGGGAPGGEYFAFTYPGELLSSIWINGVSEFYQSADCVVFGFKYSQSSQIGQDALKAAFIGSPKRIELQELAHWAGCDSAVAATLQATADKEDWAGQRQRYVDQINAKRSASSA